MLSFPFFGDIEMTLDSKSLDFHSLTGQTVEHLREVIQNIHASYHVYKISKGNGQFRVIKAPNDELKAIQNRLLHELFYTVMPHDAAHGFVPNRSILSNAEPHVGQRVVANFDITDFFPSTKQKMVKQVLKCHYHLLDADAKLIAGLCCLHGELPQGAPTSPHLANLAMWDADLRLLELSTAHNLNYTRYADDMTFSGEWTPDGFPKMVGQIIKDYGYRLAPHKIKFYGQHRRQMVTGLVVNEKINIPRETRKRLRAILHDMDQNGTEQALERCIWSEDQIQGFFSLQMMWDQDLARTQMQNLRALLEQR